MNNLEGKDFLALKASSREDVETIFEVAEFMERVKRESKLGIANGKVLATLFFQSSTRTRLSFESAMNRLGGDVITIASAGSSRVGSKYEETMADTAKVIDGYADLVAIRHQELDIADQYARASKIPVIDAATGHGKGAKHPTQALIDIYTIKKEYGKIDGVTVMISGDMQKRVMQSLAYGLAFFDVKVYFAWPEGQGYELHPDIQKDLKDLGLDFEVVDSYLEVAEEVDIIYGVGPAGDWSEDSPEEFKYDLQLLEERGKEEAIILHPLPRVDELAYDLDDSSFARYFEEAHNGVPVRMSLISLMLGLIE